ncbi:hypothetical protein Tco_0331262 [Tanacetum coccineum]
MIQPEPEDLPKDNPKLEIAVFSNYGVTCKDEAKRRNSGTKKKAFKENYYLLLYVLFDTPSFVGSNSSEFDRHSEIEEHIEEEVSEIMTETMEQYMSKTRGEYRSGVARPKIDAKAQFELKGQFLKELRDNTFSGSKHEDANEHIEKVLEIVYLFHFPDITQDQIMLCAFPVSLTGAASHWLRNEPSGSITTWEVLKMKFLNKYCPPARITKKMEEINNFQQEPDESLFHAWERFKELLMKCPQHYLTDMQEVGCELCKGPHYTKDCPLKEEWKTLEEAYYIQFGTPFQPGGQYRAVGLGFYQRNNGNSSYPAQRETMEESLSKFMTESAKRREENSNIIKEIRASTDAAIRNQGASIKTLELKIGQMSKVLQERSFRILPISTETNPKDQVKSISTATADLSKIRRMETSLYTEAREVKILDAIDHNLPHKEKYLGSFTLPCFINNVCFDKALVDLVENVLVRIGIFVFPIDFIILDIPEDDDVPLIIGRPFLSTVHVKIDVFKRKVTLRDVREVDRYGNANLGYLCHFYDRGVCSYVRVFVMERNYGVTCEDKAKGCNSGTKMKTFEENCYLLPYARISLKEITPQLSFNHLAIPQARCVIDSLSDSNKNLNVEKFQGINKYEQFTILEEESIDSGLLDSTLLLLVLKLLMKVSLARTMLGSFLGLHILNGEQRGKKERVKSIALKAKKEYSDDETSTSGSDEEEYAMAVCLRTCLEPDEWIKDSGCSKHMTDNKSLFSTYKAYDEVLNKHTMKVKESLNVTFDKSPPPNKLSPLVDEDVGEEEAIENNTKVVNKSNKEDESIEVDEVVNIKESKNHPLEQVMGEIIPQLNQKYYQHTKAYLPRIHRSKAMDEKVRESYRRLESCLFHEGRFVTPSFIEVNNMLPTFQAIGLESFLTLDERPRFVTQFYHSLEVKRDEENNPYIEFKLGQFTFKLDSSQLSRIFQTPKALETFYTSKWSLDSLDDHPNSRFFGPKHDLVRKNITIPRTTQTQLQRDPNKLHIDDIRPDLRGWELFFRENFFCTLGNRDHVNACTTFMFYERVMNHLDISRNPIKEKGNRVASPSSSSSLSSSSDGNEAPSFLEFYKELSDNEDLTDA